MSDGLRSIEFAAQLRMRPGEWTPDYSTRNQKSRNHLFARVHYIKSGKWAPGRGYQAFLNLDQVIMVRWVG